LFLKFLLENYLKAFFIALYMKIVFLGTGSMVPTKERAQSSVYVEHVGEHMLFDCGEGTQRQLRIAGISPAKVSKIFLTHWHGDHFFGLPGMLENMGKHKAEKLVHVYGPRGTKKRLKQMMSSFLLQNKIEVVAHDISKEGVVVDEKHYRVKAVLVKHSVPCLAYRIEEKKKRRVKMSVLKNLGVPKGPLLRELQEGRTITFRGKKIKADTVTHQPEGKHLAIVLDTMMCAGAVHVAKHVDLLIIESTFKHDLKHKAKEFKHLTSVEAAMIAKKAKVKQLVLTHFSQRYKNVDELEKDAKKIFKNVLMSKDFMTLTL
jgi:ribonuclease Z